MRARDWIFTACISNGSCVICDDMSAVVSKPIPHRHGGIVPHGVDASLLPKLRSLAAALKSAQLPAAEEADVLMRGLADVKIIALVDEATVYLGDDLKT